MRQLFSVLLLLVLVNEALWAAEPKVELLWPQGAPGAKGDKPADKPMLTVFLPDAEKATGAAVVVCPGGAYANLATDHEGRQIAQWFNSFGVAAFMLEYRHSGRGYGHPAPLQDAQRAIRTVRARAAEWRIAPKDRRKSDSRTSEGDSPIFVERKSGQSPAYSFADPNRIGIMGFSAGGHLASTAGTHFDRGDPNSSDPIERVSCRPDFLILCYAVIAFGEPYTHRGSQENLLGPQADAALVRSLSNEKQVTPQTPPTFLFHTDEDNGVAAENSVQFYLALRRAGVPAELHIYRVGPHGVGLAAGIPGTCTWPDRLRDWMRTQGLLGR